MIDPDMKQAADEILEEQNKPVIKLEPKYTISFINGSPGLVVRGENHVEVENAVNAILPYFKRFREAVEKATDDKAEATGRATPIVCGVCGTEMVYKKGFNAQKKMRWEAYFCPKDKNHQPTWL